MVFVLPAVALLIGLAAGWISLQTGKWRWAVGLALLLAGATLWTVVQQRAAVGLDGLSYVVIRALALLPAVLGLGIGSGIGHLRRIRRRTAGAV